MAESVISLQGLELAFGEKKVLQGVDLEVKKGETMAVIGPSGTGKSTILKVLIGLLAPTGGKVFIEGQDVSRLTEGIPGMGKPGGLPSMGSHRVGHD